MSQPIVNQNQQIILGEDRLDQWLEIFLLDRKQQVTAGTLKFYRYNIAIFIKWCDDKSITYLNQLNPNSIKEFFISLETNHNSAGVHIFYRCIKAWLNFIEMDLEDWVNPIHKVKSPKLNVLAMPEVTREKFNTLISACENERDSAILHLLYDCGARATELCNIRLEDINLSENTVVIAQGKGGKTRITMYGITTRRKIRRYLRNREIKSTYLFTNRYGDKLKYSTLREILRRLMIKSGVTGISLHSFRHSFASEELRKNTDILTISRLLGHSTTALLARYASQTTEDLKNKYISPLDSQK